MIPTLTIPETLTVIGFILILSELFIGIQTGFDLVLIGTSFIIGGVAGMFFDNHTIALILSAVLSLAYIAFGRTFVKRRIIVMTHNTNIDKLIGQNGIVIRSITPTTAGLVRLSDEDWRATSDEVLYEKDKIEVLSIEGVTIKVKKI